MALAIAGKGLKRMQVQQELERYRNDALYFEAHRRELLEQYPERWVAIYFEQVVATAKNMKTVIRQLQRKNIPPGRVFLEYVTANEDVLILDFAVQ